MITRLVLYIVVAFLSKEAFCDPARFDFYRVYEVKVENYYQLEMLSDIESNSHGYIFLNNPSHVNEFFELVVPPHKFGDFEEMTLNLDLKYRMKTKNLQELIENETPNVKANRKFGWTDYYPIEDIYDWIDEMVANHSEILSVETIGKSYEERDMKVIKLSNGKTKNNPKIFIETNIHAREWITSATVTWILNELIYSKDPKVQELANTIDWHILPLSNPDGFAYTHNTNRLWRKTRVPHNVLCYGTDPNRNFGYKWMEGGGATSSPCTETYAGPKPFSDIEVQNIAKYYESISKDTPLYLSFHSYGQLLLLPYGHEKGAYPENYDHLMQIAKRATEDLEAVEGTKYVYGTTADVLYLASGISVDWARGEGGAKLSYTYEFRDKGSHGFLLPADQIIPNAKEVLTSLVGLVDEAKKLGYFKPLPEEL